MVNSNDPAFPVEAIVNKYGVTIPKEYSGLSIRAELAARAMQGILANPHYMEVLDSRSSDNADVINRVVSNAVAYADALVEELNKLK